MSDTLRISPGIYILTDADLKRREEVAFRKGVERGRFEARIEGGKEEVARNCANWRRGRCEQCGVQWQDHQVIFDFKCPHFVRRP